PPSVPWERTCLQPSGPSQRSVSGLTSARFSESFGAHGPGFGPSSAGAAVAERAAAVARTKPRRVTCMFIPLLLSKPWKPPSESHLFLAYVLRNIAQWRITSPAAEVPVEEVGRLAQLVRTFGLEAPIGGEGEAVGPPQALVE